jgi:hypothetical protein
MGALKFSPVVPMLNMKYNHPGDEYERYRIN